MQNTIIDILQKGNLELFHSAMVAWLLDPKKEHGLKREFLDKMVDRLEQISPGFKRKLGSMATIDVKTEARHSRSRYDIIIHGGDPSKPFIVLENKTKSVGDIKQFESYREGHENSSLVALGLCSESFVDEVTKKYPLITYEDILRILKTLQIPAKNDWAVLIKHYIYFLERQILVLQLLTECYSRGQMTKHEDLLEMTSKLEDNDIRFLNLVLLNKFAKRLKTDSKFDDFKWVSYKNDISGVWLASGLESQPSNYRFTPEIEMLLKKFQAKIWFSVELQSGVTAKHSDDKIGTFQLKAATDSKHNYDLLQEFKQLQAPKMMSVERSPKTVKSNAGSFCLLSKRIEKPQDLILDNLLANFVKFCERFGSFV